MQVVERVDYGAHVEVTFHDEGSRWGECALISDDLAYLTNVIQSLLDQASSRAPSPRSTRPRFKIKATEGAVADNRGAVTGMLIAVSYGQAHVRTHTDEAAATAGPSYCVVTSSTV